MIDAERCFGTLFVDSERAFWLDGQGPNASVEGSRFSFLGDGSGPWSELLEYRVGSGTVTSVTAGRRESLPGTIFDVLDQRLAVTVVNSGDLPLPLVAGYVGYLGYETKADCGSPNVHTSDHPDAMWLFADRLVAIDHTAGVTYLVAATPAGLDRDDGRSWLAATESRVRSANIPDIPAVPVEIRRRHSDLESHLVRDRETYLDDVEACLESLRAGDSYEICLTDHAVLPPPDDVMAYYVRLRRQNPGRYSGFLRLGGLSIASSSPECFLTIGENGSIQSSPIKGTAARLADAALDARQREQLSTDPKTRAENLMIVDLIRNDLGQVCEIGSVDVPALMAIESYSTVHHLVSTIRGQKRPDVSSIRAVQACFPPGSMTGAPKLRSMQILSGLETRARGPYSGVFGYLGVGGSADLGVLIRTAVVDDVAMVIGAGGAIVLDSSPAEEFEEMLLKMAAPLGAIGDE